MPEKKTPARARSNGRPASRAPKKKPVEAEPTDLGSEFEDDERPVAVGVSDDLDETTEARPADEEPAADAPDDGVATPGEPAADGGAPDPGEPDLVERPAVEMAIAALFVLVAASMFLPIYRLEGYERSFSSWQTGTWGPLTVFLALGGAAIALVRLLGKRISLPLDPSLVYEGIGYASLIGIALKRWFRPEIVMSAGMNGIQVSPTWWFLAPMVLGAGVVFLAQASATSAPIVLRPRWFSGAGGKLGAGILAGSLLVGGALGFAVDANPKAEVAKGKQFKPGFPECMRKQNHPLPAGVTPKEGGINEPVAGFELCQFEASSKFGIKTLEARYIAAFKKAGFTVTTTPSTPAVPDRTIVYTKPVCGQVTLSPDRERNTKTTTIHGFFRPCENRIGP